MNQRHIKPTLQSVPAHTSQRTKSTQEFEKEIQLQRMDAMVDQLDSRGKRIIYAAILLLKSGQYNDLAPESILELAEDGLMRAGQFRSAQ